MPQGSSSRPDARYLTGFIGKALRSTENGHSGAGCEWLNAACRGPMRWRSSIPQHHDNSSTLQERERQRQRKETESVSMTSEDLRGGPGDCHDLHSQNKSHGLRST
ncbi:hypothetical protein PINS_up002883 [Pythium insidiosum]|nr:hypothetical protein PINS_up002883 [Pythium insidiosum]